VLSSRGKTVGENLLNFKSSTPQARGIVREFRKVACRRQLQRVATPASGIGVEQHTVTIDELPFQHLC
jgi:hypothetical protein